MRFLRRLRFNLAYLGRPPWDSGISPPELFEFVAAHPLTFRPVEDPGVPSGASALRDRGRAIDMGCGTGTNVMTLVKAGWQVTGVDFAPRAIALARRKLHEVGLQADLYVRDVTHLEGISGPFGLALDLGCFHIVGHKPAYLSELSRVLAPDGFWLMYGFFKPTSDRSKHGLTEQDLRLVERHMRLVWRRDGTDRGDRPSAWFLYQKP